LPRHALNIINRNGATEVSGWAVYAGSGDKKLKCLGVATKKGFETSFDLPSGIDKVQVAAVQQGTEVRKSNVVKVATDGASELK
jgi:hypothetical protein